MQGAYSLTCRKVILVTLNHPTQLHSDTPCHTELITPGPQDKQEARIHSKKINPDRSPMMVQLYLHRKIRGSIWAARVHIPAGKTRPAIASIAASPTNERR